MNWWQRHCQGNARARLIPAYRITEVFNFIVITACSATSRGVSLRTQDGTRWTSVILTQQWNSLTCSGEEVCKQNPYQSLPLVNYWWHVYCRTRMPICSPALQQPIHIPIPVWPCWRPVPVHFWQNFKGTFVSIFHWKLNYALFIFLANRVSVHHLFHFLMAVQLW